MTSKEISEYDNLIKMKHYYDLHILTGSDVFLKITKKLSILVNEELKNEKN